MLLDDFDLLPPGTSMPQVLTDKKYYNGMGVLGSNESEKCWTTQLASVCQARLGKITSIVWVCFAPTHR